MPPKSLITTLNQILITHQIQPVLFLDPLLQKGLPFHPVHLVFLPRLLKRPLKVQVFEINLSDALVVVETQDYLRHPLNRLDIHLEKLESNLLVFIDPVLALRFLGMLYCRLLASLQSLRFVGFSGKQSQTF